MRCWAILLVSGLLFGATDGGKERINAADLLKVRQVSGVEVARDGSFAVYGVQSIYTEKADVYSYRTHLWYVDLNDPSAKPVQLTFGDRNDGGIAISPDGSKVAFLRADVGATV